MSSVLRRPRLILVFLLAVGLVGFILTGQAAHGEPVPTAFPEYENTSGRDLPVLEGASGQAVRFGERAWVIKPGERFFSLPWGKAPRFQWGDKSFHYIGAIGGSRFRFFLIEDWGPVQPVRVIAPTRRTAAPKFEIPNQSTKPVPVYDGVSGQPVYFGKEPWVIAPGDTVLSHPWTDNKRFVLNGRPYHFIGTSGSTSSFNFFVTPDNNYGESSCADDWTLTYYGISDEKTFTGPKVPVYAADRLESPLGELSVPFLSDARLQGTGIGRGFSDGRERLLVVQKIARDAAGQPLSATVKLVEQANGAIGPTRPWTTAAAAPDLAYRWSYTADGPYTNVVIQKLGAAANVKEVAERLLNKPLAITDTGGSTRLGLTKHHLDIFVGPLDPADPAVAAIGRTGTISKATVCVKWP